MSEEELIRAYYTESASTEESERFKKQYEEDASFRAEADQVKLEIAAIRAEERASIRSKFADWDQEMDSRKEIRLSTYWKLGLAASVIIAAFFGYINWPKNDLYYAYYSTYPNYEHTTVRGEVDESLNAQAFSAYDQKDFQQANALFTKLIDQSNLETYYFFRAITYMELNQHKAAIHDFKEISKTSSYRDASLWYSALAYLQTDNQTQSINCLKQLTESEDYHQEAQGLLIKLSE